MRHTLSHIKLVVPATHAVEERFRRNAEGFYEAYRWYFVVFVVALLCDAASTSYFILRDGWQEEIHPLVQLSARAFGPFTGPLLAAVAKAFAGLVVAIYCRRYAAYVFLAPAFISLWAAWYNIWGVNLYIPNALYLYHELASF